MGSYLCFVFALMAKVTAFYVTLPLVAVAALLHFPWHGSSNGYIVERCFRRLWMITESRSLQAIHRA